MDAHYDQVMKAREQSSDRPARLYFAYSTILDREAFLEWRSQHGYDFFELPEGQLAEGLDLGLVYDFPSRWWGGRVAGLEDRPGQAVWGRLYEIAGKDWPIIQHKEGAVTGMCVEREVKLKVDGKPRTATAFTTAPNRRSDQGPVSARFLEALERGARAAALPEEWIAKLRAQAR